MSLTQKPVSTISYNTEQYLIDLLKRLKSGRIINYALCIKHKGENDVDDFTGEITTDKDHWHVYLDLAKRVELLDLKKEFNELDIENFDKNPLGCMNFQSSKVGHWLCYAVHKFEYLVIHKLDECNKQYRYNLSDIKTVGLIDGELDRLWKQFARPLLNTKQGLVYKGLGGDDDAYKRAIDNLGVYSGTLVFQKIKSENNRYENLTENEVKRLEEI